MDSYYGIILMKRIPGMPGTSPEPPGISGIPWATSLGTPEDAPGTPEHARPWDPPGDFPETPRGTPLRSPGDAPGDLLEGPLIDALWTPKTVISPQLDSARSSRLLCSKLPIT